MKASEEPDRNARQHKVPGLEGTLTHANLKTAFAIDSESSRLYLYFAKIAEIEGYPAVAETLRGLVESTTLFSHGHLDFLLRVGEPLSGLPLGETNRNLRATMARETQYVADTLNSFARTAEGEGFPDIASWFDTLCEEKQEHARRLEVTLSGAMDKGG